MALRLRQVIGFSGSLPGGAKALPSGHIVYVCGANIVTAPEDPWSITDNQRILRGHEGRISAFALSHSGSMMASGSSGAQSDVVLWDVASGSTLTRFQEHDIEVVQLAFSLDDRLLLSAGNEKDQKLFVLDTSTGKIVMKQPLPPRKRITAAAFAPSDGQGYTFALATLDGEIYIYGLNPFHGMASPNKVTSGSLRRSFTSLVFSADGQWLFAGSTSGDVVTVNVARLTMQMAHPACSAGVGAMCLTSAGRLLVGGGDGALTLLTNDHMWRDIRPFSSVPGPVTSLSSTSDGSALIVGTNNGGIYK